MLVRRIYEKIPASFQPYAKSFYKKLSLTKARAISKLLALPAHLRAYRSRNQWEGRDHEDRPVRIVVLHFWDTRPKFKQTWPNNVDIIKHNFNILHKDLPSNINLKHYISYHHVSDIPSVEETLQSLESDYDISIDEFEKDLSDIGHFNKFNFIVERMFDEIGKEISAYDYIMFVQQDNIIINNTEENIVSILIELSSGKREYIDKYCHGREGATDYVSDTVANANWDDFTHNAAVGRGLFPVHRFPLVEEAVNRSDNSITAEQYLGDRLGEKCLYLKPNKEIYFGDYFLEKLTEDRKRKLMNHTECEEVTETLINAVREGGGAVHPFLGYDAYGLHGEEDH